MKLAKRTIVAVLLLVPIFCLPNYLSFSIIRDSTDGGGPIYKVSVAALR